MKIIGLVGGMASGKSEVVRYFRKDFSSTRAACLDCDTMAKECLDHHTVRDQIAFRWGRKYKNVWSDEYGFVTDKVADIIFNEPEEKRFLEDIVFPILLKRINEGLFGYHPDHTPAVFLDCPLLFETSLHLMCQSVWFVDTNREDRVRNLATRLHGNFHGNTARVSTRYPLDPFLEEAEKELERRERNQMPLERKKTRSDRIIPNFGTKSEFHERLEEAWKNTVDKKWLE